VVGESMVGDPEQPRDRGRTAGPEAALGDDRRRERLRRQVGGRLRVTGAPAEVAEQGRDVAVVEDAEGLRILAAEQLLIGE
jgi:hypothetical protein